jgi:hypothetical protein
VNEGLEDSPELESRIRCTFGVDWAYLGSHSVLKGQVYEDGIPLGEGQDRKALSDCS